MIKFILESYSFRKILILTLVTISIIFISSKMFDTAWGSSTTIPIVNLQDVYSFPVQYDNFKRVNIKFTAKDRLGLEGNKRFRIKEHQSGFEYYDTLQIYSPDSTFSKINKIYFQFEDSPETDSIYVVVSHSQESKIYYNQIFYSSVIISTLNEFSEDPSQFRIDPAKLVSTALLNDNDTLINQVLTYFNANIDNLGIAECGRNCEIFLKICSDFNVPARMINLQGGNVNQVGFDDKIGYPLHVVCEIYSSRHQKWYVVDPTFGFRFRERSFNDYLNAVEISNKETFRRDDEIEQDSILLTKRSLVGKDYFKYYENVIFSKPEWKNRFLKKFTSIFYSKFNYYLYLFSNNFPIVKNGFYYVALKTFLYFLILILYINAILGLFLRRLFLVKKPKHRK
ncbi:MAG: hypothetical protein ABI543_03800 [Ignavibacteria bacterium]